MATVIVAEILDELVSAIDVARIAATGNQRWLNAINAAADYLLQAETVEYDHDRHEISMPSASEPGVVRKANGVCSCKAYQSGHACLHRSSARLLRRAFEARAERAAELESLAFELFTTTYGLDWEGAYQRAAEQLGGLLSFAEGWNAAAVAA